MYLSCTNNSYLYMWNFSRNAHIFIVLVNYWYKILFIILPKKISSLNPSKLFNNKYMLFKFYPNFVKQYNKFFKFSPNFLTIYNKYFKISYNYLNNKYMFFKLNPNNLHTFLYFSFQKLLIFFEYKFQYFRLP